MSNVVSEVNGMLVLTLGVTRIEELERPGISEDMKFGDVPIDSSTLDAIVSASLESEASTRVELAISEDRGKALAVG